MKRSQTYLWALTHEALNVDYLFLNSKSKVHQTRNTQGSFHTAPSKGLNGTGTFGKSIITPRKTLDM